MGLCGKKKKKKEEEPKKKKVKKKRSKWARLTCRKHAQVEDEDEGDDGEGLLAVRTALMRAPGAGLRLGRVRARPAEIRLMRRGPQASSASSERRP